MTKLEEETKIGYKPPFESFRSLPKNQYRLTQTLFNFPLRKNMFHDSNSKSIRTLLGYIGFFARQFR